jgi:hypothetical protein
MLSNCNIAEVCADEKAMSEVVRSSYPLGKCLQKMMGKSPCY